MAVYTFEWKYSLGGASQPAIVEYLEANSQSFTIGTPVVYDQSSAGLVVFTKTAAALTGIALKAATNVTSGNATIPVLFIQPSDVFSVTISNAGANDSAVHALTSLGHAYSIIASSESGETSKYTVDQADVTDKWFVPFALDPRDTAGTSGGRVLGYFTFPTTNVNGTVQTIERAID
jgi:hypothetical protein